MSSVIKGTRNPSKWVEGNEVLFRGNLDTETYQMIRNVEKGDERQVRTKRCRKDCIRFIIKNEMDFLGFYLPAETVVLERVNNKQRCEIIHGLNGYRIHIF